MNTKLLFCAIFLIAGFYMVHSSTGSFSFHKTFKMPKENYDDLAEEKDKLEILERSNFSAEDETEVANEKSKDKSLENCSRATATAQVHVRFGTDLQEVNDKHKNIIQLPNNNFLQPIIEKQAHMFDPYIHQQFLAHMYGGQFGYQNPYFSAGHSCNTRLAPECQPSSNLYFAPTHCSTTNSRKKNFINWEHIQDLPLKDFTKQELRLIVKYLEDQDKTEIKEKKNKKRNEKQLEIALEDSFASKSNPSQKKCQKRSVIQSCKFQSLYKDDRYRVTDNLEFVEVNTSEIKTC